MNPSNEATDVQNRNSSKKTSTKKISAHAKEIPGAETAEPPINMMISVPSTFWETAKFLDVKDIAQLMKVSKSIRELLKDANAMWKYLIERDFGVKADKSATSPLMLYKSLHLSRSKPKEKDVLGLGESLLQNKFLTFLKPKKSPHKLIEDNDANQTDWEFLCKANFPQANYDEVTNFKQKYEELYTKAKELYSTTVEKGTLDLKKLQQLLQEVHPDLAVPGLYPALIEALLNGKYVSEGLIERLITAGADTTVTTKDGTTILMMAAKKGFDKIVSELLKNENIDVNAKNNLGLTALHCAAANGYYGCVTELLNAGANPDIKDNDGRTPLQLALQFGGSEKFAIELISKTQEKLSNEEILFWAAKAGFNNIVKDLLDKNPGMNLNFTLDSVTGANTPLTVAAENYHSEIINMLLAAGADVNFAATDGTTPLMFCLIKGHDFIAVSLIKYGADSSLTNNDGHNALTLAASKSLYDKSIIYIILEYSTVNVNHQINTGKDKGKTALMFIAESTDYFSNNNYNCRMVQMLLDEGADPEITDANGENAVDYAFKAGNNKEAKILQEAISKKNNYDYATTAKNFLTSYAKSFLPSRSNSSTAATSTSANATTTNNSTKKTM